MAKLKLPGQLKDWKVLSPVSEPQGYPSYNIAKTEFDGTQTAAVLTYVNFEGSDYNGGNVDLINEEAAFVKSLIKLGTVSNYLDAVVVNEPSENSISLYLLTSDAKPIKKILGNTRPDDNEIVEFGLQISEILDKLEHNNILHGNLKPDNVFINAEGSLLLGGFTAFDSNAKDLSYTAPEIAQGGQPDYTTDIYSLGLMMYAMANDGRLPFEEEGVSRSSAAEKRLSKAPVTAPSHGNEKLKSVIVIACQPDNKNRWKNAGNIKNALAAIKSELPSSQAKPERKPPVMESTAFESNVFEEFAFDEVVDTPAPAKKEPPVVEKSAHEKAQGAAVAAARASQQLKGASKKASDGKEAPAKPSSDDSEIDNRVFDEYQPETKVFKLNDTDKNSSEDYGDFFEDEPKEAASTGETANNDEETFENSGFFDNAPDDDSEPAKRSKSFIIGIIVVIAAVLLAAGAFVVLAVQNGWFSSGNSDEKAVETTASATEAATNAATTAPSTTAPSTTAPETTAEPESETTEPPESVTPENVVGYFYDYAVEVLEAQGFNVDYSTREYSDEYDEDYVIAMSPDGSEPAKYGGTIKLVLSRGSEHPKESSNDKSSSTDDGGDENNDEDTGEEE